MKRNRKIVTTLIGGALIGALFFFLWVPRGPVGAREATRPVVKLFYALGRSVMTLPRFFQSRQSLRMENMRLRVELEALTLDYAAFEAQKKETKALAALLRYDAPEDTHRITARITGYARDPFTLTVFIDRGKENGIIKDAPVIVRNGLLIGRVVRVWDKSALVLLALDTRSKIPAKVLDREGALGVLEGHGALYRLTLLPRDVRIERGDIIVTETFGVVPAGLVLGTVAELEETSETPFQTAVVLPPFEPNELSFVAVITP